MVTMPVERLIGTAPAVSSTTEKVSSFSMLVSPLITTVMVPSSFRP